MAGTITIPKAGDQAPDFELAGSTGYTFSLSNLRSQKRALLIFYPKDFTSG